MKIKHSKFKNTGLIYELLVKQIASDTISLKDSAAIGILKKYYTGNTALVKEFKLYNFVLTNKGISQNKAEAVLSTITELSRKLDQKALREQKYNLIKSIKEHYILEEFFTIKVTDYKPLAALYCLLEAQNNENLVDPQVLVDNKVTILEHLTLTAQSTEEVKDSLIEEYSKYDKDLKLLTYKILLEKFNLKYVNLLPEQKNVLREFITSVSSTNKLRNSVNAMFEDINQRIVKSLTKVDDSIVQIKLNEILKNVKPLSNKERVDDSTLVNLMQYYDLVGELEKL
jgi:hypothetical protein